MAGPFGRMFAGLGGSLGAAVGAFRKAVLDTSAAAALPAPVKGVEPLKGLQFDPLSIFSSSAGYQVRPSQLTYEVMEQVAHTCSPLRAIVGLRTNQVALFCTPSRDQFSVGFNLVPAEPGAKMTRALDKQAADVRAWIMGCGDPARQDRALICDNFDTFTRKVIADSLVYDQLNFQVRHRLNGKPYEMLAMPAATMRIKRFAPQAFRGLWTGEMHIPDERADDPKYVQVYQDTPISEFTPRELAWGVRNPTTNILACGYGWSEIEDAIHLITAYLNSFAYNKKFFTQGAAAQGILAIEGGVPPKEAFDEFKREWQAMLTGVQNAHRTPMMTLNAGSKLNWVDLNKSNRDMQFTEWINFVLRVMCSLYQVDPAEINHIFNAGAGESVPSFQNKNEQRIKHSKDRGLRPLLSMYADELNSHVIGPLCPDLRLQWTGLDSDDENDRIAKTKDKVQHFMTVNEVRAEIGLKSLPDGKGDLILSSIWTGWAQQIDAQAQQDAMGGGPGEDGASPPGGGDPGEPPNGEPGEDGDTPGGPVGDDVELGKAVASVHAVAGPAWTQADEVELRTLHRRIASRRVQPLDVVLQKALVGAAVGDARAVQEAQDLGLHVEVVGQAAVYARAASDVQFAAAYLRKGGSPDSVEFLEAVGYHADVVADYRRYATLVERRDRAGA